MTLTRMLQSKGAGRIGAVCAVFLVVLLVAAALAGVLMPLMTALTEDGFAQLTADEEFFCAALKNSLLDLAIIGLGGFALAWLIACGLDALPRWAKYAGIVLLLVPMVCPELMEYATNCLLSGDRYGIVNGCLLTWGTISEPILFVTEWLYIVRIVQLLKCLGPAVLLICAGLEAVRKPGSDRRALRMPLLLSAVVPLLGTLGTEAALYGKACNYDGIHYYHEHWLQVMHQGPMAMEPGYMAAALCVVVGLVLVALIALTVPVWLLTRKPKGMVSVRVNCIVKGGVRGLSLAVSLVLNLMILVLTLHQMCMSFKSLEEIFQYPPRLLPKNPSLENYTSLLHLITEAMEADLQTILPGVYENALNMFVLGTLLACVICLVGCGTRKLRRFSRGVAWAFQLILMLTTYGVRVLLDSDADLLILLVQVALCVCPVFMVAAKHLVESDRAAMRLLWAGCAVLCLMLAVNWHSALGHLNVDVYDGVAHMGARAAYGVLQGLPSLLLSIPVVIGLFPVLSAAACVRQGEQ